MRIQIIQDIINIIRGKINFSKNSIIGKHYTIIPIGTFCLPRVITTACNLKRRKEFGEKSYPFDLAFFNDLSKITELIKDRFTDFYTDLEYENGQYINKKYSAIFNHDGELSYEEFKVRYNNRIENFYQALADNSKFIYFIYADFKEVSQEQLTDFISTIQIYRKTNFKIIILYCNCKNHKNKLTNKNIIEIIENIDINSINKDGLWVVELKAHNKSQKALKTYNILKKKLKRIIK